MALPVYTKLLFEGLCTLTSTVLFGPIPAGHVYVVRDVEGLIIPNIFPTAGLVAIQDTDSDLFLGGIYFPFAGPSPTVGNVPFRWEGRQLFETSSVGFLNIPSGNCSVALRITGYDLTTP